MAGTCAISNSGGTSLAEGSNIHFSPVDKKPLCSYSNKLCRQRRLNGYGFCIRHILEDKSAPFKQCHFVTRNNSQKCLNAIPRNQERGYCHSHMQVAGFIPKTSKKPKQVKASNNAPSHSQRPTTLAIPAKSESDNSDCIILVEEGDSKGTTEHSSKSVTKARPKKLQSAGQCAGKVRDSTTPTQSQSSTVTFHPLLNKKKSKLRLKGKNADSVPNGDAFRESLTSSKPFEQLKTLIMLEKLPRGGSGSEWDGGTKYCHRIVPVSTPSVDGKKEKRADFLMRVRQSYRIQYETLRRLAKERREAENRSSFLLRKSLLACARIDPKRCAYILKHGEDFNEAEVGICGETDLKRSHPGKHCPKIQVDDVGSTAPRMKIPKDEDLSAQSKGSLHNSTVHPPVAVSYSSHTKKEQEAMCNIVLDNVVHAGTSSNLATIGAPSDGTFDNAFDQSPHHPDSDFGDVEELERTFALHIDPEIAHQASCIMEENGLTEEDFTDLFPESRLGDQKGGIGNDLVGLDLATSTLDGTDIDYAIFSNIFQRPSPDSLRNTF